MAQLKHRFTTNVIFEGDDYRAFEALVGKGNVSREIREWMRERLKKSRVNRAGGQVASDIEKIGVVN